MLSDTPPDVDDKHAALLRACSPEHRTAMALSLTAVAMSLSRRAIAEQMAGATADEIAVRIVELTYNPQLARGFRLHLASRRR